MGAALRAKGAGTRIPPVARPRRPGRDPLSRRVATARGPRAHAAESRSGVFGGRGHRPVRSVGRAGACAGRADDRAGHRRGHGRIRDAGGAHDSSRSVRLRACSSNSASGARCRCARRRRGGSACSGSACSARPCWNGCGFSAFRARDGAARRARSMASNAMRATNRSMRSSPAPTCSICLLPLTDATRGLLEREALRGVAEGASIVNVGRGPQLNQDDLLAALASGQLQNAILDVTDPEPLPAVASALDASARAHHAAYRERDAAGHRRRCRARQYAPSSRGAADDRSDRPRAAATEAR